MDPVLASLTGHLWALLGAGSLLVFAAAMSTAALISLLGMAGIVVAIVTFVILRNPTSGGSVPNQMLPGGFRFLADVLANSAGVSLVRGMGYSGGSGLGHPSRVLVRYASIATAVCFAQAYRRSRTTAGSAPTAPRPGSGRTMTHPTTPT